jgi:hypothetical protein
MNTATANPAFNVTRSMRGDLEAENELPMSEKGRVLTITTHKSGRHLTTRAQSCKVDYSTPGIVSRSFILFGDFSKVVAQTDKRATERAIREQHTAALAQAETLLAEAEAFYTAKADKEAGKPATRWQDVPADTKNTD